MLRRANILKMLAKYFYFIDFPIVTLTSFDQPYLYVQITVDCNDLLLFWLQHKDSLKNLANVTRGVVATPASSAPSERAFSVGTKVRKFFN